MGFIFKVAFLLAYFAFFKISNLVLHTTSTYGSLKQLASVDIFFCPASGSYSLKWSQTLKMNKSVRLIKIPARGQSILCLPKPLKQLLSNTPAQPDNPLFQIKYFQKWVPLTDIRLRNILSTILQNLNLGHSNITFHSLQCSGTTLAFNSSVPIQDIQSYGTWTLVCV